MGQKVTKTGKWRLLMITQHGKLKPINQLYSYCFTEWQEVQKQSEGVLSELFIYFIFLFFLFIVVWPHDQWKLIIIFSANKSFEIRLNV